MSLEFGIPKKRVRLNFIEEYPNTPVITIYPAPTEKGKTYRFRLNPRAVTLLGLQLAGDEYISLARSEDTTLLYNSSVDSNDADRYRVTKKGEFTNAKLHQYFIETFSLDSTEENNLQLTGENYDGYEDINFASVSPISTETEVVVEEPVREQVIEESNQEEEVTSDTSEIAW